MVGLSEALSFPFVVVFFEVPAAIFRRFDELWKKSGPKAFANVSTGYLWPLVWSLHARACHGRNRKFWVQVIRKSDTFDHFSTYHHPHSDGGSTADLFRHSTTSHSESHDHRCRISGVQGPEDPATVRDPCVPTPHARNSRSQCASTRLICLRAFILSNVQAESSRTRHEIVQDLRGFPLADEPVPSYLIKRLQSIVSGRRVFRG